MSIAPTLLRRDELAIIQFRVAPPAYYHRATRQELRRPLFRSHSRIVGKREVEISLVRKKLDVGIYIDSQARVAVTDNRYVDMQGGRWVRGRGRVSSAEFHTTGWKRVLFASGNVPPNVPPRYRRVTAASSCLIQDLDGGRAQSIYFDGSCLAESVRFFFFFFRYSFFLFRCTPLFLRFFFSSAHLFRVYRVDLVVLA